MATNGVLGLGQGQAASLNSDLIEKLKTAERKATVEPLEKKLEKFEPEREKINEIGSKVDDLLAAVKVFSLNQTTGLNAFDQKSASATGDSVIFDADNLSALKTGFTSVKVEELAQKDVWQSQTFSSDSETLGAGTLSFKIGSGEEKTVTMTEDMTINDLAKELSKMGVNASVEKVGNDSFRLVIKSEGTGSDNKLSFDGTLAEGLGLKDSTNNILEAKDMKMTVDGVSYTNSSNTITVDGLKITATKVGDSSIDIQNDSSQLSTQMKDFAKAFNELNALIDSELYSADSSVTDKGALRDIMSKLKAHLFEKGDSNKTIFSYGFSLDSKTGDLTFNEKEFETAVKEDKAGLQSLFSGVAERPGIATLLDETISISGVKKSLLDYDLNMLSREEALKKEKETAEKALDSRYEQLALQFSSYGAIINQMEMSFSGLKMMIQQSVASN